MLNLSYLGLVIIRFIDQDFDLRTGLNATTNMYCRDTEGVKFIVNVIFLEPASLVALPAHTK